MMSKSKTALFVILLITIGSCTVAFLRWGALWHATTIGQTSLCVTEEEAANHDSLLISTSNPISIISAGESVAVLWDKYGKDYWACYVRTNNGTRGWMPCTQLKKL